MASNRQAATQLMHFTQIPLSISADCFFSQVTAPTGQAR